MIDFDPNNQYDPKTPVWATYIESRHPKFKTHINRGHAYNAVNAVAGWGSTGEECVMYEFIAGVWVEFERYIPPTRCEHCERVFPDRYVRWDDRSRPIRLNLKRSPQFKNPYVCRGCYEAHFKCGAAMPIDPGSLGMRLF
jgi:hypothetical protein